MKNFKDLLEARGDTAVFTFGRFNPPTTGHEKLIDALAKQQSKNAGSVMYVYPSHSQNPKKDPLPHALKTAYMRKMFPKYRSNIIVGKERNVLEVAVSLHKKGHRAIVMVVGSDRVAEFDRLLNKYNGVDSTHGYYGFDNIEVVSAGERDPDSEGVSGMSASKMRDAASAGDFDSFKTGVPSSFKDSQKLYNDVRKNMGIREEREMGEMNDFETLRDMYLTGKLWNVGDLVEANGFEGRIIRKGTNYVAFNDNTGKVHKAWLQDIVERNYAKEYANYQGTPEQIARRSSRNQARRIMGDKTVQGMDVGHKDNDPMNNDPSNLKNEDPSVNRREPRLREVKQDADVKDKKGTQPAKYFAGDMAKSTKDKRDAHFKAKKSGPAPGDATAKTKPSVHTKKFKQMYGEKYDSDKFFGGKGTPEQRLQLLKLQNKALRVLGGSPKQKAIKKEIDALRTKMGMKVKAEKLGNNADQGDYIDDFAKSDAPQFKGKSKEKRKDMAIAAYLSKNESVLDLTLETLNEDGHTDVASMKNKVQIAMSALQKMQTELSKLGDEADLPTWWTNKVATAVSRIDDMADYLDVKVEGLWDNIRKKRARIKSGSGEKMRKVGDKGAPTPAQIKRANEEAPINEKIEGLVNKAKKSGMPYGILKKVYDRGLAAYKTGHRPGTTSQQWAFARVNSFITKSSGTWGKADKDLAKQVRGESVEVLKNAWGEITEKAEYQGKSVQLNNPTKGDRKKYKVYVKNDKGNVVKVEFGDPNMEIKRDDPARRKAFRARHNCDQKKDKTTAGYWSCKFWSGKSVTDLMKG